MVQTLMESFNTNAALLARFSKFDDITLKVKTSFCDEDQYLKSMEADLGIDQGWAADYDDNNKNNRITLEGAQEALQETLQDRFDDLDDALRDGPSCRSDFTHSIGNSTLNNDGTARGPTRMEEALKSISFINKNCKLTEELATLNDHLAAMVGLNQLLVDCLCQFEFGNGLSSSPSETGDDAMVIKSSGRSGEGLLTNDDTIAVPPGWLTSPADIGDEEMVVELRGGGGD
jgi:hypothetical protein